MINERCFAIRVELVCLLSVTYSQLSRFSPPSSLAAELCIQQHSVLVGVPRSYSQHTYDRTVYIQYTSAWRKLWPDCIPENDVEGVAHLEEPPVVDDIVSLGKTGTGGE